MVRKLTRVLLLFHRISGTLLAVMFVVWFLSGFVMMYHHFPNLGTEAYRHLTALPDSLPPMAVIAKRVPEHERIRSLSIRTFYDKPIFDIATDKNHYLLSADSLLAPVAGSLTYTHAESYARRWNNSSLARVDTLRRLDPWIPYGSYKADFPIYRFHFDDKDKSILYLSSKSGKALQYVTRRQRLWAWVGPIPHMLYFWRLRQHREAWIATVSWIAGLGALMSLSGIILGIRSYVLTYRKKKRFQSPYRKPFYKWHHIVGFFFGFFVLMFVLSGLMSFHDLPQWLVKTHDPGIEKRLRATTPLSLSAFTADYRTLLRQHPGAVKEIVLGQYGEKPYYSVILDDEMQNLDASVQTPQPLYLTQEDVLTRLQTVCDAPKTIGLMTTFDHYYVGFTKRMALPVYKVTAQDADGSVFYVNPRTGRTRYYNNNLRAGKWIYPAFHSLRTKFFAEHRLIRDIVLWMLLIGGTVVSFTGLVLGIRYLIRRSPLS